MHNSDYLVWLEILLIKEKHTKWKLPAVRRLQPITKGQNFFNYPWILDTMVKQKQDIQIAHIQWIIAIVAKSTCVGLILKLSNQHTKSIFYVDTMIFFWYTFMLILAFVIDLAAIHISVFLSRSLYWKYHEKNAN